MRLLSSPSVREKFNFHLSIVSPTLHQLHFDTPHFHRSGVYAVIAVVFRFRIRVFLLFYKIKMSSPKRKFQSVRQEETALAARSIDESARAAKEASRFMQATSTEARNMTLRKMKSKMKERKQEILDANAKHH